MPIQILGLREYLDPRSKKLKKKIAFFKKNWRANSINELLDNINEHIEAVPEQERFNLQFTIADCLEETGRKMQRQDCIFFDIDNIDVARAPEYVEVIAKALGVPSDYLSVIMTGHGLHVVLQFDKAWESPDFYDTYKLHYKALCKKINHALLGFPLLGFADVAVFADTRMVRLPQTYNKKTNMPPVMVELIHHKLKPWGGTLDTMVVLDETVMQVDQIAPSVLKNHYQVDTEAVLDKCSFLQWALKNPTEVHEPEWYAMLSVVTRLHEGEKLAHKFSCEHPSYDKDETDIKIEQALATSGPRTCKNISTMYDGCKECPHFNKVKSPIMLKDDASIMTETSGFRNIGKDKNGAPVRKGVNFDDLVKYFQKKYFYKVEKQSGSVYVYEDGVYSVLEKLELENFAENTINPSPNNREVMEFVKKLQRTNLVSTDFFTVEGRLNCGNGVLDLTTFELSEHSHEYGFTHKLDYEYSEDAKSPQFDKFLKDVCSNSYEKELMLMEYFGYALSSTKPAIGQKALILVGEGANGKSVLVETFGKLVGDSNFSTLTMADLKNEQMRAGLQHKLFNLSEETPKKSLYESSDFKNMISGGGVRAKIVHKPPFEFKCMTKFVFCCNELPRNFDTTYGMNRRLMIIRFTEEFSDERGNRDPILIEKLEEEMSGILNRVIEGYKSFRKHKRFTESKQAIAELEEYAIENNNVVQWLDEQCNIENSSKCWYDLRLLYLDYTNWMRENNPAGRFEIRPKNDFAKQVKKHAPMVQKRRIGGSKTTCYRGLIPIDDSIPTFEVNE